MNAQEIIILIIAVLVVLGGGAVYATVAYNFFTSPTTKQQTKVKEWLKYAVSVAENKLGSSTGQLKLRKVYSMFIVEFPWLAKFVQFETFSKWVDEAVKWLDKQIDINNDIKNVIEKGNIE